MAKTVSTTPSGTSARTAPTVKSKVSRAQKKENAKKDSEAQKAKREETVENIIAILIVAALCIAVVWWVYAKMHPAAANIDTERVSIAAGDAPALGHEQATVTVIEFSDFECAYCGTFARDYFPAIQQRYIDTGKVRFIFMNYPLSQAHPDAALAAEAGMCAHAQGKFWEYHDLLYAHQDDLSESALNTYALTTGLDASLFKDCLSSRMYSAALAQRVKYAQSIGVSGTPTFFFNGRKVIGALTPEEFGREVSTELNTART